MRPPTIPRRAAYFFLDLEILGKVLRLPPGTKIESVRVVSVEGKDALRINVVSPTLKPAIPDQVPLVKPCWMKARAEEVAYFLSWYSAEEGTDQAVMEVLTEFVKEMRSLSGDKLDPVMDYFSPEFERAHMEVEEYLIRNDLEESLYSKQTWGVKAQLFFTEVVRRRERFNRVTAYVEKAVEELVGD
jgi:hypothetical protein